MSTSPGSTGSRTHPAIIVAAVAITAFAVVGTAAVMGWLPKADSATTPASVASPAQQVSGGTSAEYPVSAPVEASAPEPVKPAPRPQQQVQKAPPQKPQASSTSRPQPTTPNYSDRTPTAVAMSTPQPSPAPAAKICANCGTVTAVTPIEKQGEASGLGAVLGGVAGGVLGHQVGGGRGKDVATVAGAVGGAYAGHQIEKSKSKNVTWEVRVKLEDGSSQTVRYAQEPSLRVGDKVKLEGNVLVRG